MQLAGRSISLVAVVSNAFTGCIMAGVGQGLGKYVYYSSKGYFFSGPPLMDRLP